jgi:hypothetical protein
MNRFSSHRPNRRRFMPLKQQQQQQQGRVAVAANVHIVAAEEVTAQYEGQRR